MRREPRNDKSGADPFAEVTGFCVASEKGLRDRPFDARGTQAGKTLAAADREAKK